jgi:hypothetical protein
MTIGAIGACSPGQASALQFRGTSESGAGPAAGDEAQVDKGAFVDAIVSALAQIGITSATSKASDETDAAAALGDFLKSVMETLHAERQGGPPPPPPPPSASATQGSASSEGTTSLEVAFTSLLDALGVSTDDASTTLGDFLQALAGKLEQNGSSGNLVDTTA